MWRMMRSFLPDDVYFAHLHWSPHLQSLPHLQLSPHLQLLFPQPFAPVLLAQPHFPSQVHFPPDWQSHFLSMIVEWLIDFPRHCKRVHGDLIQLDT